MSCVRLILVALLFCCAIRAEASDTSKCIRSVDKEGPVISADGESVKLTTYNTKDKAIKEGNCFELVCGGFATPHRKITWYRLYNDRDNSSGLSIVEYWANHYYYEHDTTNSDNGGISSILRIKNFNKGYAGFYYCTITNGAATVQSPMTNLSVEKKPFGGSQDDPKSLTEPLYVINITAVRDDNSSLLISWNTIQRVQGAKFCRIYQEGTTRKETFKWTLHILTWPNFNNLTSNPSYENITRQQYFSSHQNSHDITLSRTQCNKKNYLFTNLMSTSYYKFQIMVQKYKKDDNLPGKVIAENGSHVHYFGKLIRPKITYPTPLLELCEPFDPNICKATGNPPPRVQLLRPVENNNNVYKCFAENTHIHNSGEKTQDYEIVDFYWNTTGACGPTEKPASPPKPSCVPMRSSVLNQYIPRGTMVYLPVGINISTLEEHAQAAVDQLINDDSDCYDQMVKFICYSYLAPCHMDTTPVPRSVCSQSCDALMVKCNNTTFSGIKNDLPEWLISRNCSQLRQAEAGSVVECIHLSVPPVEKENHSDGSCVVGKGTKYTGNYSNPGCIAWNDHRQTYFDISVFTELQSAGSSCRNPGGSGERPWCYVNLTSNASTRWKYCDVPKCPTCERVPEVCRAVYRENTTVHVHENSYPTDIMQAKCFPDNEDRCHQVWNTIICHLAYPKCVKANDTDRVHSFMPLCRSYCNKIQNITSTCQIPSPCNQSYFIHQLNNINCSALDEVNCMSADLELDLPSIDPPQNLDDNGKNGNNHQLAISIYVAAAVCMFSVFTIVIIIVGYCCCLYGHDSSDAKMVKPLDNPQDHPFFGNMKMHYIDNPDYVKTSVDKDATKSLRSISKSSIHYIRDLGSGNFGLVYQGKVEGLRDGEEFTMAAIKTLREGASAEGMKNFLHEAKLACQFDHENIIKLYGICMSESFYCLVFEYMDLGDLNEYLRNSASSTQRRIMNPLDSSSRSRTESSLSNNPPRLNSQQLVSICHQIALGMEYFAALKHVHRDLATRNCLVGTGLVVKIGDFGMSQTLYHSDYYKQKGEQALPVRWMAPEAFIYGRFSTEGDVWSFGVVMWEVFSFAMQPYYGKMNDQVMNEVRRGHTLSRPDDCPESIFEIMRSCWQMEAHRRPTFPELVEELNTWKPTRCSTSTALESQGSTKDDMDSLSLASIQDKDIDNSVFDECNMSGTEEDIAN